MANTLNFTLLFLGFLSLSISDKTVLNQVDKDNQHVKVYYEEGKFAGWPANNGIWSWGDEILVGFVQADHMERSGHTYNQSTTRYKYARSLDGGKTWNIEDAYNAGKTCLLYTSPSPRDLSTSRMPSSA